MREDSTAVHFTDPPAEIMGIISLPETASELQASVQLMGRYLTQMAGMIAAMQRRMEDLEEQQQAVTISHRDVKNLNAMIRARAAEYCDKYQLKGPKDETRIRAGIRKAVLTRYSIRDLHDCPQIALEAVKMQIERWSDIRLAMQLRDGQQAGGP